MKTETALTVIERAFVALGSSALETHLSDLAKKHADIVAIANKDGREQVHAAVMVLRKQRTAIAASGKGARDDAAKFCKAVIDEEKRLIAMIEPEEDRLIKLRDEWDQAREAEKKLAAEIEAKRKAWHESQVSGIRGVVLGAAGAPSQKLRDLIHEIDLIEPSEELHAEYMPIVARAKAETLSKLLEMLTEAEDREAEQARIKAEQEKEAARLASEREELAKLRAEAEERQRIEAEAAEVARKAEADKMAAERAELERQRAEDAKRAEAIRKKTEAKIAAERAEMEKQQQAIREQQAEIERQQRAIKDAQDRQEAEVRAAVMRKEAADRAEAEAMAAEAARAAADKLRSEQEAARVEAERKQAEEAAAARKKREATVPEAAELADVIAHAYGIGGDVAHGWLVARFGKGGDFELAA